MKYTYDDKWATVSLDLTDEKKDLIATTVLRFYETCGSWHGDSLVQNDRFYENIGMLAELADELGFQVEWKDD